MEGGRSDWRKDQTDKSSRSGGLGRPASGLGSRGGFSRKSKGWEQRGSDSCSTDSTRSDFVTGPPLLRHRVLVWAPGRSVEINTQDIFLGRRLKVRREATGDYSRVNYTCIKV